MWAGEGGDSSFGGGGTGAGVSGDGGYSLGGGIGGGSKGLGGGGGGGYCSVSGGGGIVGSGIGSTLGVGGVSYASALTHVLVSEEHLRLSTQTESAQQGSFSRPHVKGSMQRLQRHSSWSLHCGTGLPGWPAQHCMPS